MKIKELEKTREGSLELFRDELFKEANNSFITDSILRKMLKKHNVRFSNSDEYNSVIEDIIKYNELLLNKLNIDESLLNKKITYGEELADLRNNIFLRPLQRKEEMQLFHEKSAIKFYKQGKNFLKQYLTLLIHFTMHESIDVNNIRANVDGCFDILLDSPREDIIAYLNEMSKMMLTDSNDITNYRIILCNDVGKSMANSKLFNDKKAAKIYLKGNNSFDLLHNKLIENYDNKSALYLFLLSYLCVADNNLILSVISMYDIQQEYRKQKIKQPDMTDEMFEQMIGIENLEKIYDNISNLNSEYLSDTNILPYIDTLKDMIDKEDTYIEFSFLELFKHYLGKNPVEYSDLLRLVFLQNEPYYKRLCSEINQSKMKKISKRQSAKSTKSVEETKQILISKYSFSDTTTKIVLHPSFNLNKIEYIVSLINNKMLSVEYIESNIEKFKNKNYFKNIKLLEKNLKDIIAYDNEILDIENGLLKKRRDLYVDVYKLNIDSTKVFEFLKNDYIFDILDKFIELGYYEQIKKNPNVLGIRAEDILKRCLIATTDTSIQVLDINNYFSEEILTGKGFLDDSKLLSSEELDLFFRELVLDYDDKFKYPEYDYSNTFEISNRLSIDDKIETLDSISQYISKNGIFYDIGGVKLSAPRIKRNLKLIFNAHGNIMNEEDMLMTAIFYKLRPISEDEIRIIIKKLNIKIYE